jgi:hypothetical protein
VRCERRGHIDLCATSHARFHQLAAAAAATPHLEGRAARPPRRASRRRDVPLLPTKGPPALGAFPTMPPSRGRGLRKENNRTMATEGGLGLQIASPWPSVWAVVMSAASGRACMSASGVATKAGRGQDRLRGVGWRGSEGEDGQSCWTQPFGRGASHSGGHDAAAAAAAAAAASRTDNKKKPDTMLSPPPPLPSP